MATKATLFTNPDGTFSGRFPGDPIHEYHLTVVSMDPFEVQIDVVSCLTNKNYGSIRLSAPELPASPFLVRENLRAELISTCQKWKLFATKNPKAPLVLVRVHPQEDGDASGFFSALGITT